MKIIIGIGNKARNGKDVTAQFIKEMRKNVHIVHFADELYNQLKNPQLKFPIAISQEYYYFVKDSFDDINSYKRFKRTDVPALYDIFQMKSISNQFILNNDNVELWRMIDKEPNLLQFWGTDYRRKMCNENYWVDQTKNAIDKIYSQYDPKETVYFCIPDTRFPNEYDFIKSEQFGFYTKVMRMNEDGTQFIDPSRDKDHDSEISLDSASADYTIIANSGDLETIKNEASKLLDFIDSVI